MIDLTGLRVVDFSIKVDLDDHKHPNQPRIYASPEKLAILKALLESSGLESHPSPGSIWLMDQGFPGDALAERIATTLEEQGHSVERLVIQPRRIDGDRIQSFILH